VNVRLPRESPFADDRDLTSDFRTVIQHYSMHKHSKRCRNSDKSCTFGYPRPVAEKTVIRHSKYVFARDEPEQNVVLHNPEILAAFRCHHCLDVVHSDHCIGYVLRIAPRLLTMARSRRSMYGTRADQSVALKDRGISRQLAYPQGVSLSPEFAVIGALI
jgi:hypothetical protein